MKELDESRDYDIIRWNCLGDCSNEMIATVFKDRENIFKCIKCGTWWEWIWDETGFRGKMILREIKNEN